LSLKDNIIAKEEKKMDVKELELTSQYVWAGPKALNFEVGNSSVIYLFTKRTLDIVCSLLAIIVLSPFLLIIILAIRLTSDGPGIYRQNRIGKNGNIFSIYKCRSMVNGADDLSLFLTPDMLEYYRINRKITDDPRITKVGKILRKTSLDELPQIFNIFKGDMSIVGPRPLLPDEIEMYGDSFEKYISVKPGLTGLWQIRSRNRTSMTDRAMFDNEYLTKKNFTYDFGILLKTFGVVLSKKGAC
jgi:lipopolysaccharide/colanic/teichoic acid biosynthesis glycosyltransferase